MQGDALDHSLVYGLARPLTQAHLSGQTYQMLLSLLPLLNLDRRLQDQ